MEQNYVTVTLCIGNESAPLLQLAECRFPWLAISYAVTHRVTLTSFCAISMPVDSCCHLVSKNSEKCLSL